MTELQVFNFNQVDVVDSREVAEWIEVEHKNLLASIRGYILGLTRAFMDENSRLKIKPSDFFIESTYENRGKEYPCYLLTKKGCDMVANKMTGEKGVLFTAAYVTAFEKMREQVQKTPAVPPADSIATLNETVRLLLPIFDRAGMAPEYQALAMKQIYRKAGVELPVESLKSERALYDIGTLAKQAGVFSTAGKPHVQAVGCILRKLEIPDNEKELVSFEKNGHMGTTYQYTAKVADMVKNWLKEQEFPETISENGKNYKVSYDDGRKEAC